MLPDPTTTPSGSGRPGPTGDLAAADSEIAGGPESPAFVALNSVAPIYAGRFEWGDRRWSIDKMRDMPTIEIRLLKRPAFVHRLAIKALFGARWVNGHVN